MPTKKIDEKLREELRHAVEANAPSLLKPLIKAGLSVEQDIGDEERTSLLAYAIEKNAVEVVKFLIEAGAKLDKGPNKPLLHAALFNRVEIAELLLKAGANPNITFNVPEERERDVTALMWMCQAPERIEIIDLLLKYKADPNLETNQGSNALSFAVRYENIEAVRRILAAGGKPVGAILCPPAIRGTSTGLEMVKLLIAAGADVNAIGERSLGEDLDIKDWFERIGRTALEKAQSQYDQKVELIGLLESRPREDWEEETLERWKSEAQIYQEVIEELRRAQVSGDGEN